MSYQDYINCSREALLEKMAELLPEKRLTHCLGVERAAMELAQRFGVDVGKASLSLNKAVAYETARTVEYLAHQGFPIYPQTLETYNAFVHYLKED